MAEPAPEKNFNVRNASLGEILVQIGVLTSEQLQKALLRDPQEKNLPHVLESMGFTTEEKIMKGFSIQMGIPYFNDLEGILDENTAKSVPETIARKHVLIPLFQAEDSLIVAMANPADLNAIDELSRETGAQIRPVMVPARTVVDAIQRVYSGVVTQPMGQATADVSLDIVPAQEQLIRFQADDISVTTELNALIEEGILRRASDIHLEAGEKIARARFRVDGIMHDGRTFDLDRYVSLVARVKILAELDITETRLPQDGHIRYVNASMTRSIGKNTPEAQAIDIRVATVRGVFGEKVVMRILDSSRSLRRLKDLELSAAILEKFSEAIRRPNNIILVTGPTGSGKTTLLYAALAELNDLTRNIVTLEDPVEYRIDRITQIEIHPKIGLTFAAGLRSVLRQDPNIVLVGEIRDIETAEIAVQVAITGHQVFSTLHTNDAVGAVNRLITMKVEPFLISAALGGVMAQRLVRKLCPKCTQEHVPTVMEKMVLKLGDNIGSFYEATGCNVCFNTGYMGRLAIHEWLNVTRTIRDMIVKGSSIDEIRDLAIKEGMRTLQDDALEKALQGKTSLAEIMRVTQSNLD